MQRILLISLLVFTFVLPAMAGPRVEIVHPSGAALFSEIPAGAIATTADGGLVATVTPKQPGSRGWNEVPQGDFFTDLAHWDSAGELRWTLRLDAEGAVRPIDLIVDPDGFIVFAANVLGRLDGVEDRVEGTKDPLALIRISPEGEVAWIRRLRQPQPYDIGGSQLTATRVGDEIRYAFGMMEITPARTGPALVWVVNERGQEVYRHRFNPEGSVDATHIPGLVMDEAGVVTALTMVYVDHGTPRDPTPGARTVHTGLLRLDPDGQRIWHRELDCSWRNRSDASIARTADGIVVRANKGPGCASDDAMHLIGLDGEANERWARPVPTGLVWSKPLKSTRDGLLFLAQVGDPHGTRSPFEVQWRGADGRLRTSERFGQSDPSEPLEFLDVALHPNGHGWIAMRRNGTAPVYARIR